MDWIMEENIKTFTKWFVDNQSRIAELEEANKKLHEICDKYVPMALRLEDENKRLNEDFDNYKKKVSEDMKEIVKEQTENIRLFDTIKGEYKKLEKENKKLKEDNKRLKEVYEACNLDPINRAFKTGNLEMENKKLKEENEKLKEENGKLKLHIEAKDKSYLALCKDYERIKDDNVKLREKIKQWVKVIEQSLI